MKDLMLLICLVEQLKPRASEIFKCFDDWIRWQEISELIVDIRQLKKGSYNKIKVTRSLRYLKSKGF